MTHAPTAHEQSTSDHEELRALAHGVRPLTGRLAPWMVDLLGDSEEVDRLVREHGSPVNVLNFEAVARHASELTQSAAEHGVRSRVFVARKANKAIGLVRAARDAGLGVDVASQGELTQCLEVGVTGADLVLSAAVKSAPLLCTAVEADVAVSVDNTDELEDLLDVAQGIDRPARVGLRLAVVGPTIAPSRFGLRAEEWLALLRGGGERLSRLKIEGIHFHLNGYSADERAVALLQSCHLLDELRAMGHSVTWIDMGGGVPMSYLGDEREWRTFWRDLAEQEGDELTWRGDRLGLVDPESDRPSPVLYPYFQKVVRGEWLAQVLTAPGAEASSTVATMLVDRDVELRLEPGRAMLDGCGVTLARTAFRKESSDGVPLVGLHMNRTQVRSTSVDFLVDPVWVRPSDAGEPGPAVQAYLVGAYCIEDELLLRRRIDFPKGVARGDVAAFINTGGYLMHILESASHQLPLAQNVEWPQMDVD